MKITKSNNKKDNEKYLINSIKSGKIFIYPTDTIYGIGCDALNKKSVQKIKSLKKRSKNKPFSIIAPSKSWIFKNLKAKAKIINKYLPGKYTLILKKKNSKFLNHICSKNTIGIRIPKHKFTKLIQKSKVPFITTSANLSGKTPIKSPKEINKKLLKKIDIIINSGKLTGKPSTLVLEDGSLLKR